MWLDQEKVATTDEEPILGPTYLPRKFKTTVVIPPQNDVDLHANDMNFVAIAENGKLVGFNLLVGGGLSIEHGNKKTYARQASEFGYIPLEHTLAVAEAVVTTQRDWGNRTDRKNAKTKYTLERVGVDVFRAEVEKRAGITFAPIRPYEFTGRGDRIGWVKGIDDQWHLTLFIENGRLLDYPGRPLKTGMAEIAKIHKATSPDGEPKRDHRRRAGKREGEDRSPGARSWPDRRRDQRATQELDGLRIVPDLPVGDGGGRALPAAVRHQGGRDHASARGG
ncbi:hypothetical protein M8494_23475 [Serratia ureilytica]